MDLQTASENTQKDMPEEEKDLMKLCTEATNIQKSFVRNTACKPPLRFEKKGPKGVFVGYKYRRMTIDDPKGPVDVVVRSQIDSYTEVKGQKKFLLLRTYNQETNSQDWKKIGT